MDTRTLCLGLLTRGEASGYEIKQAVEQEFGHFLAISHSAIYPALAELNRDGLVTYTTVPQAQRPAKKVYRLTDSGQQAFRDGLAQSPGRHRVRSEFIALLVFGDYLPAQRLHELLDERCAEFSELLRLCREDCSEAPASARFAAGLGEAMLAAGLSYMEANRGWLEAATPGAGSR